MSSVRVSEGFRLREFGDPDVLELTSVELPEPGPEDVLIEVEVAGVNFGDTMVRRGLYLPDQPLAMAPGSEVVGRVAVADRARSLAEGDRVAAWLEAGCGYSGRVVAPAHRAYPVPEGLPGAAIAAVFLQGITAHYALHLIGSVAAGEWVLVHAAAGGLGGLTTQLAKLAGARVVGTASTPAKRQAALDFGADVALDSSDVGSLEEGIRAATGGTGPDLVVDGVSGPLFKPTLRALATRGRYVIVGATAREPANLDARRLIVRNQSIAGFIVAHIADADPGEPGRTLNELCELVASGRLEPRYEVVPLAEAPEVHRRIEAREVTGKVILDVDPTLA